jgi:hypothetical protein
MPVTTEIYKNILDLPKINTIGNGDYIIIETLGGTAILDFKDFIISRNNTTFYYTISSNSTKIDELSGSIDTLSVNTTSTINSLSSSTNNLVTLSANIIREDIYEHYNSSAEIEVTHGNRTGTASLKPLPSNMNVSINDVVLVPTNNNAARSPAWISNVSIANSVPTVTITRTLSSVTWDDGELSTESAIWGISVSTKSGLSLGGTS